MSNKREEVYCHACSVAGGADRAIYHAGPACVVGISKAKAMDNTYNVLHMDRRSRNVCIICTEDLEEAREEVALQADTNGMESLTEYEQSFLIGSGEGRCPDCIEAHNNEQMDKVFSPDPILEGDAMLDPKE